MIPSFKTLKEVYADCSTAEARYKRVAEVHKAHFSESVDFLARAPGRVNLIGEHIDYSYFSVVPMAIENDIIMSVSVTDEPRVELVNVDPAFPAVSFDVPKDGNIHIDPAKLHWSNFLKSGLLVALRHLKKTEPDSSPRGLKIVMSGSVPEGGGLSSSAAYVVTATLVGLRANGLQQVSKKLLTELSITCEQLLGVNTGGMDQSASIFGEKDNALFISFRPDLLVRPMPFPHLKTGFVFLIANSLAKSVKHETAPIHYNLRVVEVSIATSILVKKFGLTIPQDGNLQCGTLRGVLEAYCRTSTVTKKDLLEMAEVAKKSLDVDGYTLSETADALGITEDALRAKYLTQFPVRFERLRVQQRALHVYEEAARVFDFVEILNKGGENAIAELGTIMNESQTAAETLYEHSHPDAERLIKVARRAGSSGSRITGAGWGGCTVHLVLESKASEVKKAIMDEYYAKLHPNPPAGALIETVPATGAAILFPSVL